MKITEELEKSVASRPKKPKLPNGYRFVTVEEMMSVSHLSGYLTKYPWILSNAMLWDEEHGWKAGPYRYFWADQWYCVPK